MRWIILALLVPQLALSADPPPNSLDEIIIGDISGGLATSIPPHKLSKSFSPNMLNTFIDNGTIGQIKGFVEVGSTNTLIRVDGIYPYNQEDGSVFFLVTDSSMVLETSDYKTFVFVSSGLNPGVLTRCKQIENKMWCSNGVDSVFTWNHSVKTLLDGTKGNPNVPKGKYMGYNNDRVWVYNIPSDASVAYFSDSRSTQGLIIAPDSYLAWPADNFRFIGRGDGQIGTAIWQENGQLKLGKERSIYTILGSKLLPQLSNPDVGVASHDSVVMMDNQSNFVGNSGIYRGEIRNSDLIKEESDLISRSGVRTAANLWESQTDFNTGDFYGTTTTVSGVVRVNDTHQVFTASVDDPSPGSQAIESGSTYYGEIGILTPVPSISSSVIAFISSITFTTGDRPGKDPCNLRMTIYNVATGESYTNPTNFSGYNLNIVFSSQAPLFSGSQLMSNKIRLKLELANIPNGGCVTPLNFTFNLRPATTGQYISAVATNTSITTWGNFDSLYNLNGGNLSFYLRSSTSVVNITTQTWIPIVPGVRMGLPTQNTFVQWASTIQSVALSNPTNVDNVEIVHVEGAGAINRAFSTQWKNRLWIFTSTSPDTISSYGLVRSLITNKNPDAWMPISGINIRAIAKDGESTLYGGSSSSGTFYRLDFGNNFNGQAIHSFYESPDVYFDSLFKEKVLFEYYLTAKKNTGSSFSLGLSVDGGDFTSTSYGLDGSGLLNRLISNVGTKTKGKLFRWRFSHDVYDEGFTFHNFAVRYIPSQVRKGVND